MRKVTLIGIRPRGKPYRVRTSRKYLNEWKRTFKALQREKFILDYDIVKEQLVRVYYGRLSTIYQIEINTGALMALNKKRLQATRAKHVAEAKVIRELTSLVNKIADTCGLDEERIAKRIDVALQSEYGRINGLINLLSSLAKWPAEQGDGSSVATNRQLLRDELKLDLVLLEDINTFKGYHTFHDDKL